MQELGNWKGGFRRKGVPGWVGRWRGEKDGMGVSQGGCWMGRGGGEMHRRTRVEGADVDGAGEEGVCCSCLASLLHG